MTNQATANILAQERIIREFLKANLSLASIYYLANFAKWTDITTPHYGNLNSDDNINHLYNKCHDYIWHCVKIVVNGNTKQSFLTTLSQWDNGLVEDEITFKRFMVILSLTYTALLMTQQLDTELTS